MAEVTVEVNMPVLGLECGTRHTIEETPFVTNVINGGYLTRVTDPDEDPDSRRTSCI